jgi:hypothetical protein
MSDEYHTDIRKQLLALGYHIIPTRGKQALMSGWNTPDYIARELTDTPKHTAIQQVESWERRFEDLMSTGVRIEDGLVVFDPDISDPRMIDAWLEQLEEIVPEVWANAPRRYSTNSAKLALFARGIDDGLEHLHSRTRLHSDTYIGPDKGHVLAAHGNFRPQDI